MVFSMKPIPVSGAAVCNAMRVNTRSLFQSIGAHSVRSHPREARFKLRTSISWQLSCFDPKKIALRFQNKIVQDRCFGFVRTEEALNRQYNACFGLNLLLAVRPNNCVSLKRENVVCQ